MNILNAFLLLAAASWFFSPIGAEAFDLQCTAPTNPTRFIVRLSAGGGSLERLEISMNGKQELFDAKKSVFDSIFSEDYRVISIVADTAGAREAAGSFFHLAALPASVVMEENPEGVPLVKFSALASYDGKLGVYLDDEALSCSLRASLF